jgi:hypothetical protein
MDTRRATEGPAGVLDSTSRSPKERNASRHARIRLRSRNLVRNAGLFAFHYFMETL